MEGKQVYFGTIESFWDQAIKLFFIKINSHNMWPVLSLVGPTYNVFSKFEENCYVQVIIARIVHLRVSLSMLSLAMKL